MRQSARFKAILQALFVTFLWSTSWILIKLTLQDIPPLIFAGLRYTLAAVVLLPGMITYRHQLKSITRRDWFYLAILGLVFYTIAQGGQFLALNFLDTLTVSLLLNFTTVFVAVFSIFLLNEAPTLRQWIGIGVFLTGVLVYFYPALPSSGTGLGFLFAAVTIIANAAAVLFGRWVNRRKDLPPRLVTTISMGVGSVLLLGLGVVVEPFPKLDLANIAVIAWLGVVNTALAFTLWNHSLQVLKAYESSMINNTMLIQIGVLAWIFLGERPDLLQGVGMMIAIIGTFIASANRAAKPLKPVK